MDYIQYLRNMVGHESVIMVAAGVIILNAEGELLMQRRADGSGWGLVGGFMELGETVEEAARREVFEETGLNVDKLELFGVFSAPELLTYPNGDRAQVVTISYHASGVSGTPRLSSEGLSCAILPSTRCRTTCFPQICQYRRLLERNLPIFPLRCPATPPQPDTLRV